MASLFYQFLIVAIYLIYTIQKGECIQCYTCDSVNTQLCNDPFNETALDVSNCTNENFACLKREKYDKALNRTYLHRGCIQKHFCEVLAKATDYCYTCTSDYCNSSWMTVSVPFIYVFIISFTCILIST